MSERFLGQVLGERFSRRPQEGGGCLLIGFIRKFASSETSFQRVWQPKRKRVAAQRPSWCCFNSALRDFQQQETFVSEPSPETFLCPEPCVFCFPLRVFLCFLFALKLERGHFYKGLSFMMTQTVKNWPAMWETWVRSLGCEGPLEQEIAPTPAFLPGESMEISESDRTEQLGTSLQKKYFY